MKQKDKKLSMPSIGKINEIVDVRFINNLVKETKLILEEWDEDESGSFPWPEFIEGLAKEFNTTPRRIRRHLRKAGLYKDA